MDENDITSTEALKVAFRNKFKMVVAVLSNRHG
jgi:hypothetical protein